VTWLVFLDHHLGKLLFCGGVGFVVLLIFIDNWQANYFRCRALEAHFKAGGTVDEVEDEEADEG
jgi:hypothetical protein